VEPSVVVGVPAAPPLFPPLLSDFALPHAASTKVMTTKNKNRV
jgi:hypothetical protein